MAWLVQTLFLIAFAATDAYDVARTGEVFRVIITYAIVAAIFGGIHLVFGPRRLGLALTLFVFVLFVLVNFGRFETVGAFDYGFAHDNIRELMTPFGRQIVTAQVKKIEIFVFLLVPLATAYACFRWPAKPFPGSRATRGVLVAASLALAIGAPALRTATHESLTSFVASGIQFHIEQRAAEAVVTATDYPFVHDVVPSAKARAIAGPDRPRPHVLLLFLESWSAYYQNRTRADGRPYTPVFDKESRDGLSFESFYGNSVQSSRGRFATLCSLIPQYRGKSFVDLADKPLNCLPRLMGSAGYRPIIHSASDEPLFERQAAFFSHMGFTEVVFADPALRGRDPMVWGAGIQDDEYYRRWFVALDQRAKEDPAHPLFAVGINAGHHYPFNLAPNHVPEPGYPTRYRRDFVGSLAAQDRDLRVFFEELEKRPHFRDAIVIVVGDHSFPADEHGSHFNGLGAHEETFRTAFMLRWRGHVAPEVVKGRAASQLDLGPTIADLLGLQYRSQFFGRSLVADESAPPVPMVQPYDGIRLVVVQAPFKLESHESAAQEHLYDLSRDPDEADDRIDDPSLASQREVLRAAIAKIRTSQLVVRAGRAWPPDSSPLSRQPPLTD